MVYDLFPEHQRFERDELVNLVSQKFSQPTVDEQIDILLKTYTSEAAIANCNFIARDQSSYTVGNPNLKNAHTVAYLLAATWQRDFGNQQSVLVNSILDSPMGLPVVLGLSKHQT
ncbi:MAG: hypothetical protein WBA10_06430, partial [Elainellaceae cyanobacterium]